jgi:EmrB/QacA subfamily drug resistance transporter
MAKAVDRKKWILVVLVTAQFMVSLDLSVVNVALPAIRDGLGFTAGQLSWVVNAYTLLYGGCIVLGGRLGDLLDRRQLLLAGLIVFAGASLAGGLAQNPAELIAARAVQGLGAAVLSPLTLALVTTTFEASAERARAVSAWAAATVLGGAVGVVASGLLTDYVGWQWVFFVNVPIAVFAGVVAVAYLPAGQRLHGGRVDVLGAILVTAGCGALILGVVRTEDIGWSAATTWATLAVAAVLLSLFVVTQRRGRYPLMRLDLFARRPFLAANVFGFLLTAGQFAGFYFVSLHMQRVLGYSPAEAGLGFLPFCVGAGIGAAIATRRLSQWGLRTVMLVGGLLSGIGIAWFSLAHPGGSFWADLFGPSVVASIGIGASFVAMGAAATAGIETELAGMASGMLNSSRQLGGSIGLAVLTAVASSATAVSDGISRALLVGGVLVVIGALGALVVPLRRTAGEQVQA